MNYVKYQDMREGMVLLCVGVSKSYQHLLEAGFTIGKCYVAFKAFSWDAPLCVKTNQDAYFSLGGADHMIHFVEVKESEPVIPSIETEMQELEMMRSEAEELSEKIKDKQESIIARLKAFEATAKATKPSKATVVTSDLPIGTKVRYVGMKHDRWNWVSTDYIVGNTYIIGKDIYGNIGPINEFGIGTSPEFVEANYIFELA